MEDKEQRFLQKEVNKSANLGASEPSAESSGKINIEIEEAEQNLALTAANGIKQERNNSLENKTIKNAHKPGNLPNNSTIEKLKVNKKSSLAESAIQNHTSILAIVLIMCLSIALVSPTLLGMRLSALYAVSNALPASQSIQIILTYADNLASTKHYDQAISTYKIATKKIKEFNLNKQLLSLVDFKLAQALIGAETNKNKEIDELVNEALINLGDPNSGTPTNLVETIRRLAVYYTDKDDPYTAYPLVQAASRFWQTGITRNSEGNTYQDLGGKFKDKQAWALAYICFERAFSTSKSWGNTEFNAYRLGEMGLAKAKMEQTKDVADLLKRAIEMDQKVHNGRLYNTPECVPAYVNCLINLNEIYEAKKVIRNFYSYFNAKDYYDCQKKLALAYQKNKNSDKAINILKDMLKDDIAGKDVPNVPAIKQALSTLEKRNSSMAK